MEKGRLILMIFIAIFSINGYSQNSNELRVYYGISDSELLRDESLDGGGSYKITNFNEFGIKYLRQLKGNLYLEIGLNYSKSDSEFNYITGDGLLGETKYDHIEIISFPINVNFVFWKYLFLNGGAILDFQTTENTSDSQSGIGLNIGIGGKYNFDNFVLFINPNFKRHSVIPFKEENHHQKLTELGVQFGIGYLF